MYEGIEIAVHNAADLSLIDVVSRRWQPRFLDEHNRDGGGSFRIRADDPSLTSYPMLLNDGNLIKHKTDGGQVFWWEIANKQNVNVSEGEFSGEWVEVSGPGVRSWGSHAVVYPEYGAVANPKDRSFNFASKQGSWYVPAQWVPATENYFVKTSPFYPANTPSKWPAQVDAVWIWDRTIASKATVHPTGDCYFRHEFTLPAATTVKLFATVDNYGLFLIDGAKVIEAVEFESWRKTYTVELDLAAGPHVLAVRARNANAYAGVAYSMVATRESLDGKEVVYTNADRVLYSNQLAKVMSYPAQEPGWTVGQILNTLFDEAVARGVPSIARLTRTWTDALDSNGVPWGRAYDMVFNLGTSYSDVLTQISDGYADVWFSGLSMYVAQTRGVDRSVSVGGKDPVTFRAGLSVLGAESKSKAEIANTAVMHTEDGIVEVTGPAASLTQFGRRESYLTTSGKLDGPGQALADQLFMKYAQPRRTPTLEILPTAGSVPWVDFGVGDWVLAPDDLNTGLIKRRIVSLSVEEDDETGEPLYSAEIDTIQTTVEERLARWMQAVDNGSKQGGVSGTSAASKESATAFPPAGTGSGTLPLPDGPSPSNPAAPTNLIVATDTYIDELKKYRGKATVSWQHTNLDVDGRPMVPAAYEIAYKVTGSSDQWSVAGQTDGLTTVIAGLSIYKADLTTAQQYTFAVRARGDNGRTSDWSQAVSATMAKDTTAPSKPYFVSANVTTWLMTVKVAWGGKLTTTGSNQVDPPADFDKVLVYQDTQSSMATQTKIGEIPSGQGFVTVPAAAPGQQLWFRLAAVDASGNVSAYSDIKTITPQANVDISLITDKIDAAITALTNIPTNSLADKAITTAKLNDNAVDQTKLAAAINTAIGQGTTAYGRLTDIDSSISGLQNSVSGKNKIVNSLSIASGTSGYVGGDRWQQWSSLGTGGKLIASWRYNGSAWVAELIDPVYIPQIDIGAGTFGSFDGGRLTAKTVTTQSLLIGDFTNLLDDPNCEGPGWYDNGSDPVTAGSYLVNGENVRGWKLDSDTVSPDVRVNNRNMFTVEPDTELYLEATVSNRTNGTLYYRIYWYDTASVVLATGGISDLTFPARAAGDSGWSTLNRSVTPPTGARQARLAILITTGSTTGSAYVIRPIVRRKNGGNLFIDGSVTATAMAANAVDARVLKVGDFQNIAVGADFEDPAAVPFTLNALHTISTTQKKFGTSSLRLAPGSGTQSSLFTADTRVKEGEQWYIKFWAYLDTSYNGTSSGGKLRIADQGTTYITAVPYYNIPRSVWTPVEGTVTVPAGDTSLYIQLQSDHTAGYAYIDDIQIRRVSEASLIMNLGVEKLIAGTASIDVGVVNKLYAEVVRSRRMGTDLLQVGRGVNGIVDEFFDADDLKTVRGTMAGWGAWGRNSTAGVNLNWYGGTLTAGTSRNFFFDTTATPYDKTAYIPVEYGQKWRFVAQYTSATSGPRLSLRFIRKDGTTSTYTGSLITAPGGGSNVYAPPGSVATIERQAEIPSDWAYIMPYLQFEATCTSAYVYGGATLTNKVIPSLIVDGSIAALKIDTNDLSSDTGFIGSLRTTILTTDWVKAVNIDATNGITSRHTITGATFQTSVTALKGIKIVGGATPSIKAYNNTTQENTFNLDGNTGNLVATGTFQTSAAGNRVLIWDHGNGIAAIDLYSDATAQHGGIFTQPYTGYGNYQTVIQHYNTATAWSAGLGLFADGSWTLSSQDGSVGISSNAGAGNIVFKGKLFKDTTSLSTFAINTAGQSALATGTFIETYTTPVPSGTRTVIASPDAATPASFAVQTATASGHKFIFSVAANSSISYRYLAVWTN